MIEAHANITCNVMGAFYSATLPSSTWVATPTSHTYPRPPFSGCRVSSVFDAMRQKSDGTSQKHGAQDAKYDGMVVGSPVVAMETGKVVADPIRGMPHASGAACQDRRPPQPNAIGVLNTTDGSVTWYRHVTANADLQSGSTVTAGNVIGTADLSGCTNAVHTHIERWKTTAKVVLNFTITGCAGSGGTGTPFVDEGDDPYDETSFDD